MKAAAIVRAAYASGVNLAVTVTGSIKAKGPAVAVAKWAPILAANKPAIVEELSRLEPSMSQIGKSGRPIWNTMPGCLAHGRSRLPACFVLGRPAILI
jgi:hypothetical protein